MDCIQRCIEKRVGSIIGRNVGCDHINNPKWEDNLYLVTEYRICDIV